MVGSLEGELFPNDECLMSVREGLDPIDFDGLQMLTDPEMITDAATEHHLRLDRLYATLSYLHSSANLNPNSL